MKIKRDLLVIWVLVISSALLNAAPQDQQVFTDFENIDVPGLFGGIVGGFIEGDVTVGESPFKAEISGFGVGRGDFYFQYIHSPQNYYSIFNGGTITITFETPALEVQFYAAVTLFNDGSIEVFDTNNNLLTTETDIPNNINPIEVPDAPFLSFNANDLGAPGGIGKILLNDNEEIVAVGGVFGNSITGIDDFGFTPILNFEPPPVSAPSITIQPTSHEVQSGASASLSVDANGDDLAYQWYVGNSGNTSIPVTDATTSTLTTGSLIASTTFWVEVSNAEGTANSEQAVITVAAPLIPLVLEGLGDIAGENIQHPNGNVFDQILLTGESIQLQARPNQITRVSFMDETEDIVQVEFSGVGTFTVTLDATTFLPPAIPPRYNQAVEYVTGKPSVVIDGADANTFFSIFTVGSINAVNQALFPEGQVYDAQADVTLVEVINSAGMGGMQLSNTVFSGITGKVGVDARGVPIAVRLTVGDIDASGDAVPHILFGSGSFTVPAGNPGLRITGGDLLQTNGASIVVAESGSTITGFDETFISQNNFKSDNTPQPTQSINAIFINEDDEVINVTVNEETIE